MSACPTGYSGTPLLRKLGLEPGMTVRLFDAPAYYWELLGPKSGELGLVPLEPHEEAKAAFTHLFARRRDALRDRFAAARAGMTEDGMVWASWPKKASGMESEVGRAEVMEAGKAVGLVDVKVCAVDEVWSGLKFVVPVAKRRTKSSGSSHRRP